jgi:5'(3')-deoxyribonucleotidase
LSIRKPVLIVDLDDTINNLVDVWVSVYNKKHNDNLKVEQITDWNICDHTKIGTKMYDLLFDGEVLNELDIQPHCKEALEWANEFYDIKIVTATCVQNLLSKLNFVKKVLPFINEKSFCMVYDKYILQGDIIIDDRIDNILNFNGVKILYAKPWNMKYPTQLRILREESWLEIKKRLQEYLSFIEEEPYGKPT